MGRDIDRVKFFTKKTSHFSIGEEMVAGRYQVAECSRKDSARNEAIICLA